MGLTRKHYGGSLLQESRLLPETRSVRVSLAYCGLSVYGERAADRGIVMKTIRAVEKWLCRTPLGTLASVFLGSSFCGGRVTCVFLLDVGK